MDDKFNTRVKAVGLILLGLFMLLCRPWPTSFNEHLLASARLFAGGLFIYGGWQYLRGNWKW